MVLDGHAQHRARRERRRATASRRAARRDRRRGRRSGRGGWAAGRRAAGRPRRAPGSRCRCRAPGRPRRRRTRPRASSARSGRSRRRAGSRRTRSRPARSRRVQPSRSESSCHSATASPPASSTARSASRSSHVPGNEITPMRGGRLTGCGSRPRRWLDRRRRSKPSIRPLASTRSAASRPTRLGLGGVADVELDVEHAAGAHRARRIAERRQRLADGLALRVEDALPWAGRAR